MTMAHAYPCSRQKQRKVRDLSLCIGYMTSDPSVDHRYHPTLCFAQLTEEDVGCGGGRTSHCESAATDLVHFDTGVSVELRGGLFVSVHSEMPTFAGFRVPRDHHQYFNILIALAFVFPNALRLLTRH